MINNISIFHIWSVLLCFSLLVILSTVRQKSIRSTPKRVVYHLKALLVIAILWSINSFITLFEVNISEQNYIIFSTSNRFFSILAMFFAFLGYSFIKSFPKQKRSGFVDRVSTVNLFLLGVFTPILAVSDLFVGRYTHLSAINPGYSYIYINESYGYVGSWTSSVFAATLLLILLAGVYTGKSKQFTKELSPGEISQNNVLVTGLQLSILSGVIFQLLLPSLYSNYPNSLYTIGSQFAPFFFSFAAYYAVLRYKLFNIKASAFRAVGYVLSLLLISFIINILIVRIILPFIGQEVEVKPTVYAISFISLIFVSWAVPALRRLFDRITNKLFFRDAYKLPELLNELNQVFVNSPELENLSKKTFEVLTQNLKASPIHLYINHDDQYFSFSSEGEVNVLDQNDKLPRKIQLEHYRSKERVIYTETGQLEGQDSFTKELDKNNIAIVIDLSEKTAEQYQKNKSSNGNYKIMALGPKLSGNYYTTQDLEALRIISKELVIALQNAIRYEEIRLFNQSLQKQIDVATIKLKKQNKRLLEIDQLKDEFLSIASHQMRTPISTIAGYSSMLEDQDAGSLNTNQAHFAKNIKDSAKNLGYLIDEFLTVSRIKSGKFKIDAGDFDIAKLTKELSQYLEVQIGQKQLKFKLHIDPAVGEVYADVSKIRQVLINLMDNAIHYTNNGGQVNIYLTAEKGHKVKFQVSDTGIGVPKQDVPRLFTKMFRARNAQKYRPDGTGLGLYLAKKIILEHGGEMIFKTTEGQGSTFGFIIPTKFKPPSKAKLKRQLAAEVTLTKSPNQTTLDRK